MLRAGYGVAGIYDDLSLELRDDVPYETYADLVRNIPYLSLSLPNEAYEHLLKNSLGVDQLFKTALSINFVKNDEQENSLGFDDTLLKKQEYLINLALDREVDIDTVTFPWLPHKKVLELLIDRGLKVNKALHLVLNSSIKFYDPSNGGSFRDNPSAIELQKDLVMFLLENGADPKTICYLPAQLSHTGDEVYERLLQGGFNSTLNKMRSDEKFKQDIYKEIISKYKELFPEPFSLFSVFQELPIFNMPNLLNHPEPFSLFFIFRELLRKQVFECKIEDLGNNGITERYSSFLKWLQDEFPVYSELRDLFEGESNEHLIDEVLSGAEVLLEAAKDNDSYVDKTFYEFCCKEGHNYIDNNKVMTMINFMEGSFAYTSPKFMQENGIPVISDLESIEEKGLFGYMFDQHWYLSLLDQEGALHVIDVRSSSSSSKKFLETHISKTKNKLQLHFIGVQEAFEKATKVAFGTCGKICIAIKNTVEKHLKKTDDILVEDIKSLKELLKEYRFFEEMVNDVVHLINEEGVTSYTFHEHYSSYDEILKIRKYTIPSPFPCDETMHQDFVGMLGEQDFNPCLIL